MSGNTFGKLLPSQPSVKSWTRPWLHHRRMPTGLALSAADLQPDLDRRKPGTSRFTTQRKEPDEVQILSGVLGDDNGNTHWTADYECGSEVGLQQD